MKTKIKLSKYSIAVIAVWGIAFLAIILGNFLVIMPQSVKLTQLKNQYQESQEQSDHAQMAAMKESLNRLQDRREHSKQLIEKFSTTQNDVTGLVFEIGQIANELSLSEFSSKSLNSSGYSTIGKSRNLAEDRLNVEFESSFERFICYVNELERNEPVVFIEEIFFRRSTNESGAHKAKLELSFLKQTEKTARSVAMTASP